MRDFAPPADASVSGIFLTHTKSGYQSIEWALRVCYVIYSEQGSLCMDPRLI